MNGPKEQQNKKYGLILPNKSTDAKKPVMRSKPSVFDEDDELNDSSDDDKKPQAKFKVNTNESRIKKQTQINIEKALEQDPDIFEYDQIYQKLEETKHPKQQQQQAQSKDPKYIAGLMKSAALRQLEFEKRQDRKIQKERELEGDLFHGKEAFVTEAYRKRMEEKQRLEEEERKQDELEARMDVTKLKDMKGFYESILKLKTGEYVIEEEGEKQKRIERENKQREEKLKKDEENSKFIKKPTLSTITTKTFRSRKNDEVSSESEEEKDDENQTSEKKENQDADEVLSDEQTDTIVTQKADSADEPEFKKPKLDIGEVKETARKIETKQDRWKRLFTKRTVDKKFDDELRDYFMRKNANLALKLYVERE